MSLSLVLVLVFLCLMAALATFMKGKRLNKTSLQPGEKILSEIAASGIRFISTATMSRGSLFRHGTLRMTNQRILLGCRAVFGRRNDPSLIGIIYLDQKPPQEEEDLGCRRGYGLFQGSLRRISVNKRADSQHIVIPVEASSGMYEATYEIHIDVPQAAADSDYPFATGVASINTDATPSRQE